MSNAENKVVLKLREICSKIAKEKNSSVHVAELKRQIANGRYYEQQSFKELVDVASNKDLSNTKAVEILKLLRMIVDEGTGSKDYLITQLYNFLAEKKVRFRVCKALR